MPISPFPVPQRRREWVDGGGQLWMTLLHLPFWEGSHFSYTKSFKKLNFIQVILKTSKGEAEGLPWLHSGVTVQKK
jgi:hypothetical protein